MIICSAGYDLYTTTYQTFAECLCIFDDLLLIFCKFRLIEKLLPLCVVPPVTVCRFSFQAHGTQESCLCQEILILLKQCFIPWIQRDKICRIVEHIRKQPILFCSLYTKLRWLLCAGNEWRKFQPWSRIWERLAGNHVTIDFRRRSEKLGFGGADGIESSPPALARGVPEGRGESLVHDCTETGN